jgi:hypothetical protein
MTKFNLVTNEYRELSLEVPQVTGVLQNAMSPT